MTTPSIDHHDDAGRLHRQRGLSLIEAMVSALLLSIVFLGLAYILSRGLVSQRYMNAQGIVLMEMREGFQSAASLEDLCAAPATISNVGSMALLATCATVELSVSFPGFSEQTLVLPHVDLSTSDSTISRERLGGDGVVRISSQ